MRSPIRVRLAPSPTGYLHLGNAWTFLWCVLAARSQGGTVVLRIEDVDTARSRHHFADAIQEDLDWLGLSWDEGPYFQAPRVSRYTEVLDNLMALGHAYPCFCSRKDLQGLASAPHGGMPAYPGTCRHLDKTSRARKAQEKSPAIRLVLPESACAFHDLVQGPFCASPAACGGDFPVRRGDGLFAYQLAVAVDDMDQHISLVVRGADLLNSTARQQAVFQYLGAPPPHWAHVPLLVDPTGERLAKRHQSLSLRALRAAGIQPEAICGFLAWLGGLIPTAQPMSAQMLPPTFSWQRLPRTPVLLPPNAMELLTSLSSTSRLPAP